MKKIHNTFFDILREKETAWRVVFGCLLLCLLFAGCRKQETGLMLELEKETGDESVVLEKEKEETEEPEEMYIYVCGEVREPGVVALTEGSRVDDAVRAAGGMTENADGTYVNLAEKVKDGEKIFIPSKEEAEILNRERESKESGLININTADIAGLCTLSGIGESRAADIIAYREQNGPFKSTEDIMKVPGIKTSAYAKISDKITVE